jgi:hypothetical protein
MRARLVLVIAVAAASCRGSRAPASVECTQAGARVAAAMRIVRPDLEAADVDPEPVVTQLCVDDRWPGKVIRCYVKARLPREARACSELLTADQRTHAREAQAELYRRASTVASPGNDALASCAEYARRIDRIASCDQAPPTVKEALRQAADAMRAGWENIDLDDPQQREAAEMGCRAAVEGLAQTITALGC